ncbi:MAG: TylF/MycF/NovP-related O-methyltransferase [Planctomycetota bacterium]
MPNLFKSSRPDRSRSLPPDIDAATRAIVEAVAPFTMTSPERIVALRDAVRHACRHRIPGDIVECGVWRGGSMMAAALALLELGERRTLHLFDTFEGMPPPGDVDRDIAGVPAAGLLAAEDRQTGDTWAWSPLEDVRANVLSTGYPAKFVRFVPGRVEETIPAHAPERIAVLRLDTDWYESTRHELEHLFPRLAVGGVLIIDDYGHWQGARRAVDEYLASTGTRLFLSRIDYTGRLAIKIDP